jgi:hypothetical protein
MLGKLIKYEWKRTSKVGCLLLGAVALITLFGWMAFQTPMWNPDRYGYNSVGWLDIFGILTLVLYVVMLVAVTYGITIYMGVHFYKTMYTDEGYLLHTLPVTKHEILGSKVLIDGLWVLILTVSIYLSVFVLFISMVSAVTPKDYTFFRFLGEVGGGFNDLFYLLGIDLDQEMILWVVMAVLTCVLTPFSMVATLFGAVSIGQLCAKHRVLMAIVSYVGIIVGESIVGSLIRSIMTFSGFASLGDYLGRSLYSNFWINLLVAIGLYFVSWHVIEHRLNME